jgi:hypothetical protein
MGQPPLQLGASQQDAVSTPLAAQPDVGPESHDFPLVVAAGVRLAEPHQIAKEKLNDRSI